MDDLLLWSSDRRFGLSINKSLLQKGITQCADADYKETGGILMGFYNKSNNCAIITTLSGAPSDSIKKPTNFIRGTLGLQNLINRLWREYQQFYLGEWHFHPRGTSYPSHMDLEQMQRFSNDETLKCPEPILLIIGGDPKNVWTIGAYVFPKNKEVVPLLNKN